MPGECLGNGDRGGIGFAGNNVTGTNPFIGSFSFSNTHTAWIGGGGVEYAFLDHWSARFQYQYVEYNKLLYNNRNFGAHGSELLAGVNYRI